MKKMIINSQPVRLTGSIALLLGLALSLTLFSFSSDLGGDTYEIHLNGKLLLQQHVWKQTTVADLSLNPGTDDGELAIYYSHCGVSGKARTLTIQDEKHSVLKEWRFNDAADNRAPMTFQVKNLAALDRKHGGKLNLYYTSKELPESKLLVSFTMDSQVSSRKLKNNHN